MMEHRRFDADWLFLLGDAGGGAARGHDDSGWRRVALPHDWSIELPRRADAPGGATGGFFEDGVGWYRKHFTAPEAWRDKSVAVEFEGVYRDAEIWINGHHLGVHPYGYTTFTRDLTAHLRIGDDNVLALRVDNASHPHTRWYSGSGIYRHVWLQVAESCHIAHWGIRVVTPSVSSRQAVVRVAARVLNRGPADRRIRVAWRLLAPGGAVAAEGGGPCRVAAGGEAEAEADLTVNKPCLWSPDSPALYCLESEIWDGETLVDAETTRVGIRGIHFSAAEGFVLNGQPTLLRGGCVHHDCGPLGAASFDRAEERKVELLKASGFNAVRCAHNPPAPAFLDACDRLGMLVIDEAFDVWRAGKCPHDYHRDFDRYWKDDLDSMLMRDRNHPCIVLWSIGNELIERALPEGAEIAAKLAARVRQVDPSRPVTAGICGSWDDETGWRDMDKLFASLDVCGYNYQLDTYRQDHEAFPERIMIATESFPPRQYDYWKAVEDLPYVAGDFVWTSLDYLGEAGIGRVYPDGDQAGHVPSWPWCHANCGDIDLCGLKRPQSHYRDVMWGRAAAPFIGVHPPADGDREMVCSPWGWHDLQVSWTWPGLEGQTLKVDVYSDADEIELLLNGDSLGRVPVGAEVKLAAGFEVAYRPGELKAVAYRNGQSSEAAVLQTAGPPTALRLLPDRTRLAADPNDLAFVAVEVVDAEGRAVPVAEDTICFTVLGPARIAAVANSNPRSLEPFRGNLQSAWRGRCLAVVQPTGTPGAVTLRATADGLDNTAIDIAVTHDEPVN